MGTSARSPQTRATIQGGLAPPSRESHLPQNATPRRVVVRAIGLVAQLWSRPAGRRDPALSGEIHGVPKRAGEEGEAAHGETDTQVNVLGSNPRPPSTLSVVFEPVDSLTCWRRAQ